MSVPFPPHTSVIRWLLHRLHQSPPEAQPAGHRPLCGRPGLGRRQQAGGGRQPGPVGEPGGHQPGENVLLPALRLRQATAHQLPHHHQGGHPGAAEEVHGAGQSLQVCAVQADAPGRTGWVKDTYLIVFFFSFFFKCAIDIRKFYLLCSPLAALLQKLPQCDHPLLLRLIAGPDPDLLSFILKENETGEVEVSWGRKNK